MAEQPPATTPNLGSPTVFVDSRLYDNLVEVTDGAKRSFILREAIKSSLKADKPTQP